MKTTKLLIALIIGLVTQSCNKPKREYTYVTGTLEAKEFVVSIIRPSAIPANIFHDPKKTSTEFLEIELTCPNGLDFWGFHYGKKLHDFDYKIYQSFRHKTILLDSHKKIIDIRVENGNEKITYNKPKTSYTIKSKADKIVIYPLDDGIKYKFRMIK